MKNIYKKLLLLLVSYVLILETSSITAQQLQRCGTMEYLQLQKQNDPTLEQRMLQDEMRLQEYINASKNGTALSVTPIVIPVVVHVIWNFAAQNISDARILEQINVLNEDFNRLNADTVNTPAVFQSVAASSNIMFCLASTDPNGNPTNGIHRVQTTVTSFSTNDNVKYTATGGTDAWDVNSYFNIWVCNLGGGLLGYSPFPSSPLLNTYGTVVYYGSVGGPNNPGTAIPYHLGRVATHEIGHLFNLYHTFQASCVGQNAFNCSTQGDMCCDTPPVSTANFGCPTGSPNSCIETSPFPPPYVMDMPDMFTNFMDFTDDDCLNIFTLDQATRMNATINVFLSSLISNVNCIPLLLVNYGKVKGTVFYDINQNGIQDGIDAGIGNQKILSLPDSTLHFTAGNGQYKLFFDSGAYVNQFIPNPSWILTSDSASYTISVIDSATQCCFDFGTSPSLIYDDLEVHLTSGPVRCGFNVPFWINYQNTGTSVTSGIIWMLPDDSLQFVSSVPAPDSISNDTLFWSFFNLFPGAQGSINLIFHAPITPGILVCSVAQINLFVGTTPVSAYADTLCSTVTCSFDPNDKLVDPLGILSNHYTLKTDTLEYTIRFQNTGTDSAFTVILRDTLNNFLDISSFEITGYSHPVITWIDSNRLATFLFDNILLPHSAVNAPASHGFVKFRILPVVGVPDGTVITNSANIYFDFNSPIITNSVFNTLVTVLPVGIVINDGRNISLSVIPLPFHNECEVHFISPGKGNYQLEVYDLTGRIIISEIKSFNSPEKTFRLNTKNWINGFSFFRIFDEERSFLVTGKLLKQ